MTEVYGWIRSLTGFFLFLAIVNHLLPGKQEQKYIRPFAGVVLLLVIGQPLVRGSGLVNRIADEYEKQVLPYDRPELSSRLPDTGDTYQERMIAVYEEEAALQVMRMAEKAGYPAVSCQVLIGKKEGTERYGKVEAIRLNLAGNERKASAQTVSLSADPIHVEAINIGNEKREPGRESTETEGSPGVDAEPLRAKLAALYDLEERYVEIQIAQGER